MSGLSAGSAGDGALTGLGPIGWQVGLVAALEIALVAAVVAWELRRRAGASRGRLIDLRDRIALPSGVTDQVRAVLRRR
jgi:membrane protein implicated in regulation of membrane protease activity